MEMTPEEACEKWCPNYRTRNEQDNSGGRCLGPACADWVWIEKGQQPPTKGKCGLVTDD